MKVLIPLAGLIDKNAEIERLSKDISKLEINIGKTRAKLANPGFTDKAPAAVVEKEQQRMQEQEQTLHDLLQQREKMAKL